MADNSPVVDGRAVTVGSKTYALENIALATVAKSTNAQGGAALAVLAGLGLVGLVATGNTEGLCLGALGALMLMGVIAAIAGAGTYHVQIETTQGKRRRIWTAPESRARALADQINEQVGRGGVRVVE